MRRSFAQLGFSIECGDNKSALLGECGGISALVDSAFSIMLWANFDNNKENQFLNGVGSGTHAVYVARNDGDSNNNSITFSATDASGDERKVTWEGVAPDRNWLSLVLVSSGSGADNLKLFVNNVEVAITSQTNDIGFSMAEVFDLMLGSASLNVADTEVTSLYFYDRAVTEAERLAAYEKATYSVDYIRAFPLTFPHRGLAEELPTYA